MKKQDIYILLKLACMQSKNPLHTAQPGDLDSRYSARGLSAVLGVSKSEVNASIRRSADSGLLARDFRHGLPKVNRRALYNFIVHGIRHVFPVRPGGVDIGVPTACYAPVFEGRLHSMSDSILVWPCSGGNQHGQAVSPLHECAPMAALKDSCLYDSLALVDSIRLGQPREAGMAAELLDERLNGNGRTRRAA